MMLGLGHDVVDVEAFAAQQAQPGSRLRRLFSVRELRQAAAGAQARHDSEAMHLAAKWAGKEATLKAWCEALGDRPYPYTLDDFPWSGVEVLDDSRGRPHLALRADVAAALRDSLGLVESGSSAYSTVAGVSGDGRTASVSSGEASAVSRASGPSVAWHVSLSHDGPIASAVVMLETV